jgi:hypothetical protein
VLGDLAARHCLQGVVQVQESPVCCTRGLNLLSHPRLSCPFDSYRIRILT